MKVRITLMNARGLWIGHRGNLEGRNAAMNIKTERGRVLSRQRRRVCSVGAVAVLLFAAGVSVLLPATKALGFAGPPPPSGERRVLSTGHVDAIAVYHDGAVALSLGSKADVDGQLGKRLDPASTVFNLGNAALGTVPEDADYGFLGEPGTSVWVAPEANPGPAILWPGISTTGVETGQLDDDEVTLSIEEVEGPGAVHLYQASAGAVTRLLSGQGDAFRSWTVPAAGHVHANWAFTAAGTYRLHVRATAQVDGEQVDARAVYRFQVGAMALPTATTTTLESDASAVALDDSLVLTATVEPASAAGWVEFFDGSTSLGHDAVHDGQGRLEITASLLGERSYSAVFAPQWTDEFASSTSPVVSVAVSPAPGARTLTIAGTQSEYANGETVTFAAEGAGPGAGETYAWVVRAVGAPGGMLLRNADDAVEAAPSLTRTLDESYNGYELVAQIRSGTTVVVESPPVRFAVNGSAVGFGVPVTVEGDMDGYIRGEYADLSAVGEPLAEGQSYRWVLRNPRTAVWFEPHVSTVDPTPTGIGLFFYPYRLTQVAVQVVSSTGEVLGQSPHRTFSNFQDREILLGGLEGRYLVGAPIRLSTTVTPAVGDDYSYEWTIKRTTDSTYVTVPGERASTLTLTADMSLHNASVRVLLIEPRVGRPVIASPVVSLLVTDQLPSEQELLISTLADHYHSGDSIQLGARQWPVTSHDRYAWFIKRVDQADFVPVAGFTGSDHTLRAEQALDSALVKAQLLDDGGNLVVESAPRTIHVSDHGNPPPERVTIDGPSGPVRAGEELTLRALETPESVLDRYEWWIQRAGQQQPSVIDGANSAAYSFTPSLLDDGAKLGVRLTFNDGTTYVASTPLVLVVEQAQEPKPSVTSQTITATLDPSAGALVLSVDPSDREVVLPKASLSSAGDRWTSSGRLRPVTVTDTRSSKPGWQLSGQVSDFGGAAGTFSGRFLGWIPGVLAQSGDQLVQPGTAVPSELAGGDGLATSSVLARADAGAGLGTARLGGELELGLPTTVQPGSYAAVLTFTLI